MATLLPVLLDAAAGPSLATVGALFPVGGAGLAALVVSRLIVTTFLFGTA